jgi:hypothetical protein
MVAKTLRAFVVVGFLVGTAGWAQAASITGSIGPDNGCVGECLNTTWTLTASDEGMADSSRYNMHVSLMAEWPDRQFLDEDGRIDPNYITSVEFGLPGKILAAAITTPAFGWDDQLGPLTSNGCRDGNGNFICSEGMAAIVMGDPLVWEWDVSVPEPDAVLDPEDSLDFHVGAQLARLGDVGAQLARLGDPTGPKDHTNGWLVSVNPLVVVNPIPEPTAGLCFGFGVLIVSGALRRRPPTS